MKRIMKNTIIKLITQKCWTQAPILINDIVKIVIKFAATVYNVIRPWCKKLSVLVGGYLSVFSFTLALYTYQVNSLDKDIDLLKEQGKHSWERIGYLQNVQLIVEPDITKPSSVCLSVLSLFFDQIKDPSAKHIHRLQMIIQSAEKGSLKNIRFNGLILAPKVKIINRKIQDNRESNLYYLDFQNSDFQESTFENSLFSNLDLTNSIFLKSRFDNTNVFATKLNNVNMENTTLDNVNFYKSFLLNTNAKNTVILNSSFESSHLTNTNFSNSLIVNSSFRNTNLQGTNFHNTIFSYDDNEFLRNSFKYAIFNSKKIDKNNLNMAYRIESQEYKKYVQIYCNKAIKDPDVKNLCIDQLIFSYNVMSMNVKATRFPKDLHYKDFDMIDFYDFVEFLEQNINVE